MSQSEERTAVRTYVPAYQKEIWVAHADELDMSHSEFVRTMVQVGRRTFDEEADEDVEDPGLEDDSSSTESSPDTPAEDTGPDPSNPWGRDLETVVLDLCREEARDFEEIVETVFADLREELDDEVGEAIRSLQSENQLTHDPIEGGYTLPDDE